MIGNYDKHFYRLSGRERITTFSPYGRNGWNKLLEDIFVSDLEVGDRGENGMYIEIGQALKKFTTK